jgi:hypothetical protein
MKKQTETTVAVTAPNIRTAQFTLVGTAPYVQLRFSQKAINEMAAKMTAGSTGKKGKQREARDFQRDFEQAQHISTDGWNGIPASAFRNALISACRLVGFKMTMAKLSVFVPPDGFDKVDDTPLVRIHAKPELFMLHARNATGVIDLRVRAKFWPWSCELKVRYDADQFTETDIANLLVRVGEQVGIGEGRNDSKMSCGMGFGSFRVE